MGFLCFLINTIINYYGYVGFGWLVLGGGGVERNISKGQILCKENNREGS